MPCRPRAASFVLSNHSRTIPLPSSYTKIKTNGHSATRRLDENDFILSCSKKENALQTRRKRLDFCHAQERKMCHYVIFDPKYEKNAYFVRRLFLSSTVLKNSNRPPDLHLNGALNSIWKLICIFVEHGVGAE